MLGWSQACYKLILAWSVTTTRSSDCLCMRHSACSTTVLSTMRTSSTSIRSWQKWPPNTLGRWVLLTSHHGKNGLQTLLGGEFYLHHIMAKMASKDCGEVSSTYITSWQKWPPNTFRRWVLLTSEYGKNGLQRLWGGEFYLHHIMAKMPSNTFWRWVLFTSHYGKNGLQTLWRAEFY